MNDKLLPPHNTEAEEAVIGSILIGGDISELTITPDDFMSESTGVIFSACLSLQKEDISINQITLAHKLDTLGKLDKVGGSAYLSHMIANCPTHLDMRYYADIVKTTSLKRKLIQVGNKIIEMGYSSGNVVDNIASADSCLMGLRRESSSNTIISPYDRANLLIDRYEQLNKGELGQVAQTGLTKLDRCLGGGLYNGELVIVAARPGMGKTSLLQNIANNISSNGKTVLFCSAEMSEESISHKDVAAILGVPTFQIRKGLYSNELYSHIVGNALGVLSQRQVYIYDDTPLTADKIMQACIEMQTRHKLDAVFVDYLGMLDEAGAETQNIRLGNITRKLKYVAKKLDIPMVVAHQLSRGLEMRTEKRPQLHDLRESGHIEEDADVVMFIYRDSYYEQNETKMDSCLTEIIIGKHRLGISNIIVKVWYDGKHQQYKDILEPGKNGMF